MFIQIGYIAERKNIMMVTYLAEDGKGLLSTDTEVIESIVEKRKNVLKRKKGVNKANVDAFFDSSCVRYSIMIAHLTGVKGYNFLPRTNFKKKLNEDALFSYFGFSEVEKMEARTFFPKK